MAKKRRFHRERGVRWHKTKRWVATVGQVLKKNGKLGPKDWYFPGHHSETDAEELATHKAQQWEIICRDWHKTDQPLLESFGEPFPDEPRWNTGFSGQKKRELTAEEVETLRRENHIHEEELMEVLADYSLVGFIDFYRAERMERVRRSELRNSSLSKMLGQMRLAAKFFPDEVPAKSLQSEHFKDALKAMHEKHERRTVRNYMSAALELLRFIYSTYRKGVSLPPGIEEAAAVPNATRTDIEVYELDDVKKFLRATEGTISQLDIMLALNCGMYPQDIGRLLLSEIDLIDTSAFWDREKEPQNPFRLHHAFWPETHRLVLRFLNSGKVVGPPVLDYRRGPDEPEAIDPKSLAFLDNGKPRYWNTPGGYEKNWVSKRMHKIVPGLSFRSLRKTANENFMDMIEHDDSQEGVQAVEELSKHFLGQATDSLIRLYRLKRKGAYKRMNRYLAKLGEKFRAAGIFERVL